MMVMKFGGGVLRDAESYRRAAGIVEARLASKPVVVVSAVQGVTDILERMVAALDAGDRKAAAGPAAEVIATYMTIADGLGMDCPWGSPLMKAVDELNAEVTVTDEPCYPPGPVGDSWRYAAIVTLGEAFSAALMAGALGARGVVVPPQQVLITDWNYRRAAVDLDASRDAALRHIVPVLNAGGIPIIGGFTGSTPAGKTTCLGRNSSDSSAAWLAAALGAAMIQLWKDVGGVKTAPPGVVPDAGTIPLVSYRELAALAHHGAKIIHARGVRPAERAGIPIRFKDVGDPDAVGTLVQARSVHSDGGVKAVTALRNIATVTVTGKGIVDMVGFAGRVCTAASAAGVNIIALCQDVSEQNVMLTVDAGDVEALENGLRSSLAQEIARDDVEDIAVVRDVAAIAVVGDGMVNRPGTLKQIFSAVSRVAINVSNVMQAAEHVVTFIVAEYDADNAVRAIHEEFNLAAFNGRTP